MKKYKIVKEFNGYRVGLTVAFNGADAEKYKDFIIAKHPAVLAPAVEEVKPAAVEEEKPVKKTVRRVKKGRK